ncbi:hypothetical protein PpBr36_07873 [Pyricularia pennisetigena]|uniref:hypothetical protein n=1 Tax=Pyricularia pennisetigena TaxID=1578925 RepID=UPI00114F337C|nr:hypothetical protein PpBr36_07873 [Pyricularia pennisetigena]TLS25581.1 hypothetical protein PpBr36_07873 [Pyricularia pennisetigena]
MASHIFRIFKPEESKQDRAQRRRDQLRDAQKTYRDRKTKYVKSLENELSRVRQNETHLMRQVEQLRSTLQSCATVMRQNGLDVPPGAWDVGSPGGLLSPYGNVNGTESSGPSSVFGTESDLFSPFSPQSGGVISSPPQDARSIQQRLNQQQHHQHQHQHSNHSSPNSSGTSDVCLGGWDPAGVPLPAPGVRVCDVDLVGAGMDFVLTIERPCLDHLHGDPTKPDDPDGHALTVSSYLITASKGSSQNTDGNGPASAVNNPNAASSLSWPPAPPPSQPGCGTVCHDVPTAVLDNLLNLSGELVDSDHEVTPVQAWHYIRSRPQFGGLEVGVLGRFARKLRDAVKCHGFGAVIERTKFESLVRHFLRDINHF